MRKAVGAIVCVVAALLVCIGMRGCAIQTLTESSMSSFRESMIPIPDSKELVYDPVTKNVYVKNMVSPSYRVYVPYFASNGFCYQYDASTKSLVENDSLEKMLETLKENY